MLTSEFHNLCASRLRDTLSACSIAAMDHNRRLVDIRAVDTMPSIERLPIRSLPCNETEDGTKAHLRPPRSSTCHG